MTPYSRPHAADLDLASCHSCGKVSPVDLGHCPRCHGTLHLRKPASLARTVAFLLGAIALYIPANLLPVMAVKGVGGPTSSTIMSGVILFWNEGSYPVSIIIFTASIAIPILKIIAITVLCLAAAGKIRPSAKSQSKLYHITEIVGRWSMVDVFVVAVLATLVRLGALMTITPGPAALSFAGVVILTMLSAMSFDPRLLWDRQRKLHPLPQ